MTDRGEPSGLPLHEPSTWLVFALSGVFVLLGLMFIFAPRAGAAYLAVPSRLSTRRTMGTVLGLTVLIPAGDIILILLERGFESPKHLLLHGGSGIVMAAGAFWLFNQSSHNDTGGLS
jgi:drug/metabolite transporter (DMT)-like permease